MYNKNFHNVMETSKGDFEKCSISSPVAIYTSGNDSIRVKSSGHKYFVCGVPGHCEAGQKVEIDVQNFSAAAPREETPAATRSSASGLGSLDHFLTGWVLSTTVVVFSL